MTVINQGSAATAVKATTTQVFRIWEKSFVPDSGMTAPLVTTQPLNQNAFLHAFRTNHPRMRLWQGERLKRSMKLEYISGQTDNWECTIAAPVVDIMSDRLRTFYDNVMQVALNAGMYVDERVADVLNNGTNVNKYPNYDGLSLFNDSHARDDGTTQDNNLTGTALTQANLITAYETMMSFTDPEGVPLNKVPRYLIVPTQLSITAVEIVKSQLINDGDSNVFRLGYPLEVIVLPWLSSATTWYLAADKPFVNHEFQPPQLSVLAAPSDGNVFWNDEVVYGVTARSKVLPGPWENLLRAVA